jgi:hypothetical protein
MAFGIQPKTGVIDVNEPHVFQMCETRTNSTLRQTTAELRAYRVDWLSRRRGG